MKNSLIEAALITGALVRNEDGILVIQDDQRPLCLTCLKRKERCECEVKVVYEPTRRTRR